jgi:hypothetical protein
MVAMLSGIGKEDKNRMAASEWGRLNLFADLLFSAKAFLVRVRSDALTAASP